MKKFLIIFILFLIPASILLYYKYAKDREKTFDKNNLFTFFPNQIDEEISDSSMLSSCFSQKFTYFGHGAQIYAFLSEDGKTVLKLFKAKHIHPNKILRWIRSTFFASKMKEMTRQKRWVDKFYATCKRYQLAWNHLRPETCLVYLHFEKTNLPNLTCTLLDKNKTVTLDLNKYPFILQKRAILVPEYLTTLIQQGNLQKAESAVKDLRSFLIERTRKGFTDPRQSYRINFGYFDDKPVQIDIGKLYYYDGSFEQEVDRLQKNLDLWLMKYYPELLLLKG
ncbi:MAG: hypothetical protein L0207_00580 [Chlamydiae bacterium]|nr:hypothetical protein [Chlamydiota bacterium]